MREERGEQPMRHELEFACPTGVHVCMSLPLAPPFPPFPHFLLEDGDAYLTASSSTVP